MTETVNINGLTLCHKHSSGYVRSTLPDVCKAPKHPVPFTNTAYSRDLAKGTTTVKSHGGAMCGIKGAEFSQSFGDEPGVGGGVKSGVNRHRATFLSWSPDVRMQGKPVTRLTDRMLLNKGNTISAGGYYTGQLEGPIAEDLEKLCEYACECMDAARKQNCVAEKIKEDYYKGAYPENFDEAMCAEVSMIHNPLKGVWAIILNKARNAPTSNPITPRGGIRPDVVCRGGPGGQNRTMIEMKFPGDELTKNQRDLYPTAADDLGAEYETLDIEDDCDCSGGGGGTAPEAVTIPEGFNTPVGEIPNGGLTPLGAPPVPTGDLCRPTWIPGVYECVRVPQ